MEFKLELPNLGKRCEDTLDPSDHVANYHVAMSLKNAIDNIICQTFSMSLERSEKLVRWSPSEIYPFFQQLHN